MRSTCGQVFELLRELSAVRVRELRRLCAGEGVNPLECRQSLCLRVIGGFLQTQSAQTLHNITVRLLQLPKHER